MSKHFKPWFERSFPGGYPVELFANLFGRLCGTHSRAKSLVDDLDHEQLIRNLGGTWSMQRNLGHLLDLEKLWLGRVEDYLSGRDVLTPADLENRATHDADHDQRKVSELLQKFQEKRGLLLSKIAEFTEQELELSARHPRLGQPMRMIDSLVFVAEHDDHHIARLIELRRSMGLGISG
ncbi:MAG: DinB family protein [Planctomycetota bacterium]|jgi:uncharacterized damage-inducible protein DinB